jgi:3-oxoadipate enol-lactonase
MKILVNDILVNYEISGNECGPVIVMSHSLGCNLKMWDNQLASLEKDFLVLRYDTRGHGLSDAPEGPYTLKMLGEDAVGLFNALGIDVFHWVGLSMGGMIGQYIALKYPDRSESLTLCDTGPAMPDEAQPIWQERINEAHNGGMKTRLKATFEDWFTPDFLKKNPPALENIRKQLLSTPIKGYIGCIWAIRGLNYIDKLTEIKVPTLIIVGKEDFGTPIEVSRIMHNLIQDSELVILPSCAHLSSVEQPETFNAALLKFLNKLPRCRKRIIKKA